jgi:hypothetical protein
MELSLAIGRSIEKLRDVAQRALVADTPQTDFWLDELLVEIGAYSAASHVVLGDETVKSPYLKSLLRSVDVEIQGVLVLAQRIVAARAAGLGSETLALTVQLVARQRRLAVKGHYLVNHLKDYFAPEELHNLGDAFADERAANCRAVHTMSFGG